MLEPRSDKSYKVIQAMGLANVKVLLPCAVTNDTRLATLGNAGRLTESMSL